MDRVDRTRHATATAPIREGSRIMATQGKVAFITGANKGLGLETARGLGQLGIAVVIGSRDEAKGREAAETLRVRGDRRTSSPSAST